MDAVMQTVVVPVKVLDHAKDLDLPDYATAGAAGMDLLAAVPAALVIKPGHRELIPAGIAMALPVGFEAQVRPRSGLAIKHGVTVLNAPGTIDCDYRGEVGVILVNLGQENFTVERGMRVAQVVIAPYARAQWHAVNDLSATDRGTGGFGSTGLSAGSDANGT